MRNHKHPYLYERFCDLHGRELEPCLGAEVWGLHPNPLTPQSSGLGMATGHVIGDVIARKHGTAVTLQSTRELEPVCAQTYTARYICIVWMTMRVVLINTRRSLTREGDGSAIRSLVFVSACLPARGFCVGLKYLFRSGPHRGGMRSAPQNGMRGAPCLHIPSNGKGMCK